MTNLAGQLAALPEAERRRVLAGLSASELATLEFEWSAWARPDQLPPDSPWRVWLLLAGRGAGKTRSSAEWVRKQVETGRRRCIGLVGPTSDTLRRDQVAAIIACSPPWNAPQYEPSQRRIIWPNGATAYALSSEEPDRIRGLNLDAAWVDELCSLSNQADVWSNLQMALRVPGPKGDDPQMVISTTPKRQSLLKAIMADGATVITRSTTWANAANLSEGTLTHLRSTYGGTTLGRQELEGEILDDVDGALWSRSMLDEGRVKEKPDLRRIVVAIDPAGSSGSKSDETGIIAAGLGPDGHGYVLADASGKYTPEGWARAAIWLYRCLEADRIVCETNYGGAMVQATLRAVDRNLPIRLVQASRGKAVRAEPIVAFYEQRRVHHVGNLPGLEDQLCGWNPTSGDKSPDRLDALVWALTDLMGGRPPMLISEKAIESLRSPGRLDFANRLPGSGMRVY